VASDPLSQVDRGRLDKGARANKRIELTCCGVMGAGGNPRRRLACNWCASRWVQRGGPDLAVERVVSENSIALQRNHLPHV
jgi:hypothetical protein